MLDRVPFVKLFVPFVFGILSVDIWPISMGVFSGLFILCIGLSVLLTFKKTGLGAHLACNLSILLVFYFFGGTYTLSEWSVARNSSFQKEDLEGLYLIRVHSLPEKKPKSVKIKAYVLARIDKHQKSKHFHEQILAYLPKNIKIPEPGEYMFVKCSMIEIPRPENPYQFNYKKHIQREGIFYQTFIYNPDFVIPTKKINRSIVQHIAFQGSTYLSNIIRKNCVNPVNAGVVESLLFGYKDDLEKNLVDAYAHSGTLHVLAVSGMHVALVFLLLSKLLWFLDIVKHGKLVKTLLTLGAIWCYCILTGLAPSILRAGLMISLILIGKALNRTINIYNLMAVSAFFILLSSPYFIYDIGFQLSFAAVIGIVGLQPIVSALLKPSNIILREIWDLVSVSICAQIAAFPISLFYFHQFPNYFIISNLLIIPLSSLAIYTSIGMAIFAKVPLLLSVFSYVTETLVSLMNGCAAALERLPYSYSDGIKIDLRQTALIYFTILCLYFWIKCKFKTPLFMGLTSLLIICEISSFDRLRLRTEKSLTFFNVPNQNVFVAISGSKAAIFSDFENDDRLIYYLKGWLINKRLWPCPKIYNLTDAKTGKIEIKDMDLYTHRGFLMFKKIKLYFGNKRPPRVKNVYTYISPTQYNFKLGKNFDWSQTCIVGSYKSMSLGYKFQKLFSSVPNIKKIHMLSHGLIVIKMD